MMSVVTPHTMIRMIGGRRRFGQRIADVLRAVTVKWWRKWASSSLANREPIRSARGGLGDDLDVQRTPDSSRN
jgi:hypothetical protein